MWLSPQSVLALAGVFALASLFFGLRAKVSLRKGVLEKEAWPAFVEAMLSSLAAGLSRVEAAEVAVSRAPASLRAGLAPFARSLKDKRLTDALPQLKSSFANAHVDEFVELLTLNERLGGAGLVGVLKNHAKASRERNAASAQARSKNAASLAVAKIGVASPWILLGLLLCRPESASSFQTAEGIAILLSGLVVCVMAYRLIVFLGRASDEVRVYG